MINNTTYRLYGRTKGRKKNKNNYSFLKIKLINIDHTKYNILDIGSGFGERTIKIAKKDKKRYFILDNSKDSKKTETVILKKLIKVLYKWIQMI